jgi:uncharacterized repeat protein (TIGR02543 family)
MDETVKRPPNPSKEGFVFIDWYTDNDTFELLWDFDTAPNGYMTLHAKWDMSVPGVNTFTVTFDSDGGSKVNSITVEPGSVINKPADPTKTGYDFIFTGWYEKKSQTNTFDFDTPITTNITLYAKWRPYELGETGPGGGKIFYRSKDGFTMTYDNSTAHYLEVTPADIGNFVWASQNDIDTYIPGTESGIGTGRKNTSLINEKIGLNAPAAYECFEYNNGKSDWFLPSIDELEQLYIIKDIVSNLNGIYLSSTQYNESGMFIFEIYSNNKGTEDKNFEGSVRAVRAF